MSFWTQFSTESWTTIRFRSKYVEGTENLPIINLNYKVPALRMNNERVVSPKDPLVIQIIPQSLKGLDISQVRFWYSYDDGLTWKEAKVIRGDDLVPVGNQFVTLCRNFIVKLNAPTNGISYISIKTLAIDTEGNSVEQIIMRAFLVTRISTYVRELT